MSYQRPQDPYIHSNASQFDDRYQQPQQQHAGAYSDYPDRSSDGYYGGQHESNRNAATQAAATYSYAKPKKRVSKWVKIGIPLAIILIAAAVVAGILGARAAKDNQTTGSNSQGKSGQGSKSNVDSNTLSASQQAAKNGGNNQLFYKGTDPYSNPSFVSSQVDSSSPSLNGKSHGNCNDPWSPSNSLQNLRPHPRIIAPQYQWDCLPERIRNDAYLTVWNQTIFKNATAWAKEDPVAYSIDGGSGLLDVSREIQQRVKTWAYAFKLSGDQAFKDRLYRELNTAAGNTAQSFGQNGTRWNPDHFLDVAEMTAAFAIGYDWLYNDWSDSERSMIRSAIINYGLIPGQQAYAQNLAWWSQYEQGSGNWNCVCNSGLVVGALAVLGDDSSSNVANSILNTALANLKSNCMRGVYSDGTWTETPNYWYFGTNAQARAVSALTTATGNDQGVMASNPDWLKTVDFHMYVTGHAGMFAYGDNGPNKFATTANQLMLYSRLANDARGALFQRDRADASFDPLSMFWYDERSIGAFWNGLALDRFFDNKQGGQWASMRSSWTDPNAVYVGIKSSNLTGHQTHGDLDAGDFVIDALGTRWAGEYGNGNYLSTDYFSNETAGSARWTFYRKATQGQNTLVINDENQNPNCLPDNDMSSTNAAQSGELNYKPGKNDVAFFRTDMSSCYSLNNGAVRRGIRLLNGRRQVLVQDEIAQNAKINNIKWRVQTNGTVESISSDKRTVTLSISSVTGPNAGASVDYLKNPVPLPGGKKTMVVKILEPAGATFTTTSPPERIYGQPVASPPGEQSDQPNPGVTVLQIELQGGSAQRISVVWQPQWDDLSDADRADPPSVALDSWSLTSHNA